jgi:hypothetical protein
MWEYTSLVNEIFRLQIPYEVHISKRFEDAGFVLFDTHALLTDIFDNPSQYLNSTSPPDVTHPYHECNITTGVCVNSTEPFDSFFWYAIYVRKDGSETDFPLCLGGMKCIQASVFSRSLQKHLSILLEVALSGLSIGSGGQ